MMNKTTNNRGQSNARARSFDPVKLLRYSLLCMLILLCGGSALADEVYYTLDGTITSGGNSNYDQDGGGLTQNKIDWSVTGNTTINPWRIGGKNLTSVDREAYSKTAMGSAITKVVLEIGDINLTSVNSIKLIVASDADFSKEIETIEKKDITANSTLTFNPTSTEWAKGAYYKFVFNITAPNSNKYIQFKSAKFYAVEDTRVATELKFSGELQTSGDIGGSMDLPTVTVSTPSATLDNPTITWESSDPQVASISNGTINFLKYGITTITATFAETDSYLGSANSFSLRVCGATEDGIFNFSTNNDYGSGYEQGSVKEQSGTWTAGNVTMALSGRNCWYSDGTLRIYKPDANKDNNGKMTFSVPTDKAIKGITISGSKLQHLSADGGTYSVSSDKKTGTWTGNANSVVLTLTGSDNSQINTITVTYGDPSVNLTAPTFTPAEGTYYGTQNVTLSCETTGATIYYSTDNETFSPYSGPIEVSETTTIYAYSQVGDEKSATVSAKYTIGALYTSIQNMQAAATSTATTMHFTPSSTLQVVYVKGKNAYVVDENGYGLLIYNNSSLKLNGETAVTAGQVLSGGTIMGALQLYYGNTEISGFTTENVTISNAEVTPVEKALPLTGANQSTLVTLKGVTYDANAKSFSDGENTIAYNDKFSASPTLEDGKTYDVTGIVNYNNETLQISPRVAGDITEAINESAEFRDIKINLMEHTELLTESNVYITVAENGTIGITDDATKAAATIKGKVHGSYGSSNFTASVPVEGCVKITYATHDYGNDITVTNDAGAEVAKFNTMGDKWMNNHNNVVVAYYRTNEPTTLHFSNANYNPYFAVEAIAEEDLPAEVTNYNVTFVAGEGVEGVAPAAVEVEAGNKITAPANYTLYKDGSTLTGWTDGETTYAPGDEITPAADMQLTAVFTENTVNLADRTEAVTISYELNGSTAQYKYEGNTGIIVTQATVNGESIDVIANVDATSGKFTYNNGGWHQVNTNTKVTIPSCEGATIKVTTYQDANTLKFGDTAATAGENPATFTATAKDETLVITQTADGYWSTLEITLPVVSGEDPVSQDVTATWDFTADPAELNGTSANLTSIESNVDGISLSLSGGTTRDNGNSYQFQSGVTIQIPVKSTKDVITVIGYPGYTSYTIGSDEGTGNSPDVIHKVTAAEANQQYAVLTAGDNCYIKSITVLQKAETSPATLDNEPATATFPFNLGTEGQKATFTKAEYWLGSKVTLGSNFTVNGTGTVSEITETKLKVTAKETAAAESNLIKFTITPKPGLTFTPTKVTFTATRYGTDGGALDIAWLNSGKTTTTLANLKKADGNLPGRDNKTPNFTTFSYDLTTVNGIIAGDGECGLLLNLYDLDAGKNYGFANIIIEGTLSGTEKDVPVLATFTVNGKEYQVEDVFGDGYEATLKLSKTEAMVSSTNAVTATATNGEIGTITYENATETGCKVTIPVTAGETTMNYVLNVTQKPDYTLTYYAVDGTTVLDTDTREEDQTIGEFKVNIADVDASKDGYKARGWFKQNNVGAKYKTTDVVTSNLNLYAVETEIEVSSDFKKYEYDLTDVNFDANDHEAFNPTGIARWHDKQHGWEFKNGDKIDLLVGPKANIIFTLCQHSAAGSTITWDTENSISAVGESDAAIETIAYEGEAGTLSLTINTSNTVYIHRIKIVNTTTTNYTQDGQWIFVKPGDASSFLDALDAANATDGEENVFIFLPDGTYDLGQKTKTSIGRNNISIIGNSMDEVIIKNAPTTEGIDATATLLNTSSNLYMQDLTIECDAPWIGNAERGVTLQDKGNQTILKNVYLKGKQDTYYSNNPSGTFYFEDGIIQGSVDYVCGYGDVYFNNTSFYTVNKSTGGKGGCIAAPNTLKSFGYIFNSCILDGQENENGLYRLARPWGADTKCFFVNTIMVIQPNAAGWGEWSSPKNAVTQFAEYNSVDGSGTPIDLTSRATTIGDQPNNPWLTEAEAAALTPNAIFNGDWKPQVIAMQLNPPSGKLKDGTITWDAVKDAIAYAIYDGDELLGITTGTSWTIENVTSAPRHAQGTYSSYSLRSANSRGGFGEAVLVSYATGIDATLNDNEETTNEKVIYDLNGRRVLTPTKGVYIINGRKVVIK